MKKINQVAALRAKFLLHLIGYPGCSVAHAMNWRACAKPGLHSTVKEALPRGIDIALERATKGQCLAALRVRKTYLGLLPAQRFTFAFVALTCINVHDGHHAAVCLDDDRSAGALMRGPALPWRGCFKYPFGMALGDAGNGAFAQNHPVVLNEFVHGLGKGLIGTEVGDHALERARAATVAHLGALGKRADRFRAVSVLGLLDADVAKGGVPAEFFLPALQTPALRWSSCEVFSTWCWAQD